MPPLSACYLIWVSLTLDVGWLLSAATLTLDVGWLLAATLLHRHSCFRGLSGKEFACQCGSLKQRRFDPWVRKTPWRRKWQPTPVSLPGESYGQSSLEGHSPWGCKEQDTTEQSCVNITWWIISFWFPLFALPPDYYVCFSSCIFPIVLLPNIFIPFHLHVSFLFSEVRKT